jgi:hypothetical protein
MIARVSTAARDSLRGTSRSMLELAGEIGRGAEGPALADALPG